MRLKIDHQKKLGQLAQRGLFTMVFVLFFWGTIFPAVATRMSSAVSVRAIARHAGVCNTVVLIWTFSASYFYYPSSSIVGPHQDQPRRHLGFVLFWFGGSILFDVLWQIPLWSLSVISQAPVDANSLWWCIPWWSYTVSDSLYEQVTPLVVAFEIWWMLGNLLGVAGLFKYRQSLLAANGRNINFQQALVLLCLCGTLQCYNATIYLFIAFYVEGLENIAPHWESHFVFWGLNGFWATASGVAAWFSYELLLASCAYVQASDDKRSR